MNLMETIRLALAGVGSNKLRSFFDPVRYYNWSNSSYSDGISGGVEPRRLLVASSVIFRPVKYI